MGMRVGANMEVGGVAASLPRQHGYRLQTDSFTQGLLCLASCKRNAWDMSPSASTALSLKLLCSTARILSKFLRMPQTRGQTRQKANVQASDLRETVAQST